MLNKSDPVPLYIQLQRIIKEEILQGKYEEGQMIPSETQLSSKYGITRTTVRKAISMLANEGYLHQVHGKGTFVCFKQMKYNLWNFGGFTDYLKSKNEVPVSKLISMNKVLADDNEYIEIKRARGVKKDNDKPLFLTIDTSLIPMKLFPDIDSYDFQVESLYNIMRTKYDIYPKRAVLKMSAVESDKTAKEFFNLDRSIPLLMAQGSVYDLNNIEIEKVKVVYGPKMDFNIVANMETYRP
ncbi:GntR family transcriptional regulator [Lutispora thermophila]|uniref:GntR family transcriptional regulator n=1 Tax=Lutispora thermophila DSM 19022 TaxID=1122184 RepID=A0A1M6FEH2_9FIRM|nr:GntR family transcriptional regulator [Lutispora thermophila]SHI96026.1 GntR family transcriptional regulator [Lutispora thermophila DSM 19022]